MIVYSLENGSLIRVNKSAWEIEIFGPPDIYSHELEIDPETNSVILNYIDTAWNDTLLIDGVLTYQGNEVPVNPPGQVWLEQARQEQAEQDVANIPNWATWTEAEALVWFDANVVDLASARTVLRAVVRLTLAMRNKLWPNLEGS